MTHKGIIEQSVGNGLFSSVDPEPEDHFSHDGCDYCRDGAGDVIAYHGYLTLEDAHKGPDNLYEFELCEDCLYSLHHGDE